jgi:hypothetical protein
MFSFIFTGSAELGIIGEVQVSVRGIVDDRGICSRELE